MRRSIVIATSVALCTGCTSIQQQAQTGQRSTQAGNNGLINVFVPGAVPNAYDPPGKTYNPLLSPRTKPPAFKESAPLSIHCVPGRLDPNLLRTASISVDTRRFDDLMLTGQSIAADRHVWRFNVDRTNAQIKVASHPRFDAPPRPNSGQPTAPVQQRKPVDFGSLIGSAGQQRPRYGLVTPAEASARSIDFDKMRADLEHNRVVLAQQDETLKAREQGYADQLLNIYQAALNSFVSSQGGKPGLQDLNGFDRFRQNNIEICLLRARPAEPSQQSPSEIYTRFAQSILTEARPEALRQINQTQDTAGLQDVLGRLYSTPFLRTLAEQDKVLTDGTRSKRAQLEAKEERARELARRAAEAEVARQQAQLQKQMLDKAARNIAPTNDEVLRLLSVYMMEKTNQTGPYGRLVRTSPASFDYYSRPSLLGEFRLGSFTSSIYGFSCKPVKNRQKCQFSEGRSYDTVYLPLFSEASVTEQGTYSGMTHEVEFFWTKDGLQSPELKKRLIAAGPTQPRGRSNRSSDDDSEQSRQDRRREQDDYIRERSQDEAAERQRQQDEAQRQWQAEQERRREANSRRCPGINICN